MWVTEVKLGDSIELGPGLATITLSGLTVNSAIIKIKLEQVTEFQIELSPEAYIKISKEISVKLLKCKKTRASIAVIAPSSVKFRGVGQASIKKGVT